MVPEMVVPKKVIIHILIRFPLTKTTHGGTPFKRFKGTINPCESRRGQVARLQILRWGTAVLDGGEWARHGENTQIRCPFGE